MTNISTHSSIILALLVKYLRYRMLEQVTLEMNHKTTFLGLAAIVAAVALTTSVFAVPQQALAGGHHHHNSGVKVNQQIDQLNACSFSLCVNQGNNTADIDR